METIWTLTFWGVIKLPRKTSKDLASALAYIAWKGGVYEDVFKTSGVKRLQAFAKKHPDLLKVKTFDVYPVPEFQWTGEYLDTIYQAKEKGITIERDALGGE